MQSEFHSPGAGTATMMPSPFSVLDDAASYASAVDEFLTASSSATVPVWTGGRADLAASVERAAAIYANVSRPVARTYGVVLKPDTLPAGLGALLTPLARTWLDETEVEAALLDKLDAQEHSGRDTGQGEEYTVLIAGLYEHFTADLIWPLVRATAHRPNVRLTFLTGRDAASLAWFTAKQYVHTASDVRELGLYTAVDRGLTRDGGIQLRDERGVETADVKSELLGTRWRRLFLQGHGRDDSLNLAEFTICGRNDAVERNEALVAPLCAFTSHCYKPDDKLIQLREIRAAEIVLSSCNNSPFADAAAYDPKYQLVLNAIDGTAKDIVGAITVHDSGRAENVAWAEAALAHASSVTALNSSIRSAEPFPAYVHFGIGDDPGVAPEPPALTPEPLLLTTSARLTAYLAGGLLSANNPLRPRLDKLAAKVENQVSKRDLAVNQDRAKTIRSLMDDLQSVDMAIATQFVKDPDNELSNCYAHFGDRGRLDFSTIAHVRCQCGRPAERYVRRALVPTALDTEGVICTRCGDVAFRLNDSPSLLIYTDEQAPAGATVQVRVAVREARPGILRLGLFFASYGRAGCTITPELQKVRIGSDGTGQAEFALTTDAEIPPHNYYMTAYAVQDLAVTIARRNFGVMPATAQGA
ncbi:hypothetical protein [Catellatospora chokoriensis]|uniref:Uncharacterized protein n=1 Tax=Catellatospora chokoriensis TaxID=310353 RepID=A0A8J3NTH4_9ACTN|nr:hypothetical protein [Catellatospora chokoriensis]GIF90215.1 hypothetical protein Cch02nite_36590 [Catellatospora chokoriensis]